MNELKQQISQILSSKQQKQSRYKSLMQTIRKKQIQICNNQIKNIQSSIILNMIIKKCNKQDNKQFYKFLEEFVQFVYTIKSGLQLIVYQIIPLLLTKYIQNLELKLNHLENCIKIIYNHQYMHFNKNLITRELLINKSGEISHLYKEHFNSVIKTSTHTANLSQIPKNQQINSFNRVSVKSVLLLTMFNNLQKLTEKTVISYLWMVYIYCGGTQQQQQTGVSLYLLQKKNMFSIFKYYISGQEMSIILLTLYELSMQRKKNKFQILSAINIIHKKAANQSMFKLSQVAQSTIHLLQDQYSEAFS